MIRDVSLNAATIFPCQSGHPVIPPARKRLVSFPVYVWSASIESIALLSSLKLPKRLYDYEQAVSILRDCRIDEKRSGEDLCPDQTALSKRWRNRGSLARPNIERLINLSF